MHIRRLTLTRFFLIVTFLYEVLLSESAGEDYEKTIKAGPRRFGAPGPRYRRPRSAEQRIKMMLLRLYDKTTRPVLNDSTPIKVQVAISLYHILDTNEKEQTFTSLLAIRQKWRDEYLTWNSSDYGGVTKIRVPADKIWTPDLFISNFAGDKFNDYMTTNAIVDQSGEVLWLFPALIKTYCTLNVTYFPLDTQRCKIVFISWTHSKDELDVVYNTSFGNSVYYESNNQEWAVDPDGITAERHELKYACCEELYPDVTFTIYMRRGSLFYIVNLISPCFLIFLISFLGFFLPVESGEKVNLEITILLALVVFLLRVGETMPPTPDSVPILGMFFAATMVMVSIALVMAVIVTNIYAKKNSSEQCPAWALRLAARFQPSRARALAAMSNPNIRTPPPPCAPGGHQPRHPGDHASRPNRRKIYDVSSDMAAADVANGRLMAARRSFREAQASSLGGRMFSSADVIMVGGEGGGQNFGGGSNFGTIPTFGGGSSFGAGNYRREKGGGRSMERSDTDGSDASQEKLDQARLKAEWRMVAQFADRVFLWVFLVISLITNGTLLFQMLLRAQ